MTHRSGATFGLALLAAVAVSAPTLVPTPAEAVVCRPKISATGTGQGILGAGTMNAKAAAIAAFEARAAKLYGSRFSNAQKAAGLRFDCRSGTLKATCVVTGRPCR
jgi:hypothetical protein